jgi:hypothetical protein
VNRCQPRIQIEEFIAAGLALAIATAFSFENVDHYFGISGPTSFGSGNTSFTIGGGDTVCISGAFKTLFVPQGYVSGPLSSSVTWDNASFASLGVTPGTYVWPVGVSLLAARQFLCSVSVCLAWLLCGAN